MMKLKSRSLQSGKNEQGFTFLELVLVVAIMSLLIVAILYGQTLYETTKLKSVYTTTETISAAYASFKKKYNALPGDMKNATTRLTNCTSPCINGTKNDSFIGKTNQQINDALTTIGDDRENVLFFYHLQKAGLINSIDTTAPLSDPNFGKSSPKAGSKEGGFVLKAINLDVCYSSGKVADMTGIWLVWQKDPFAPAHTSLVVSSNDAKILDKRYDDGEPGYGNIRAGGANSNPIAVNDGCRSSLKDYLDDGSCYMYFRISRDVN